MTKTLNFDKLSQASEGAALAEKQAAEITYRTKTIKTIPSNYFEAHNKLKKSGKTGLLLTAYMIEALKEKLERDGGL